MPTQPNARLLAPIALVLFAIVFFAVILNSGSGDGGGSGPPVERPTVSNPRKARAGPRTDGSTYTVKSGDTLVGIADKTGVPIEKLQELNPELDPQALVSGQKIKLRE
jgi:hypothetical protein